MPGDPTLEVTSPAKAHLASPRTAKIRVIATYRAMTSARPEKKLHFNDALVAVAATLS